MITNLQFQSLVYNLLSNDNDRLVITKFLFKHDVYTFTNYWLIIDYLKTNKPIYTYDNSNILIKKLYRNKKLEKILK